MDLLSLWLTSGILILTLMSLAWVVSLALRDSSIVDILWGLGFVLVFWTACGLTSPAWTPRLILMAATITLWGVRLSLHIWRRNAGRGEDPRYAAWRAQAGPSWWWRSLFQVFLLQGGLMGIIALPLVATPTGNLTAPLRCLDYTALGLWIIGFIFEAGGDWQLERFRQNPANRGRVLTTGLWSITRHPNYFGDAAQWWAFWLIAASAGASWTVISPLLMTFLLVRVSGVALLERTLSTRPEYREYMARTSSFFPWFPKRLASPSAPADPRASKPLS